MMNQKEKADRLRALHDGPEVLVLCNVADAIGARIVETEGFPAVATSSAGVAAVLGYPDGQHIPRPEMLFLIGRIARSVDVPVTADIEAGYSDPVQTAREVIAAGAVGMNLEDMKGDELIPLAEQVDRIRAVRAAAKETGVPLVLNARTDIFLAKHGDASTRFDRAVERLNAYQAAGADCLFAPGVVDMLTIIRLVSAVKGPLNILATVGAPSIAEMQRAGVRRVSLGSGPSRVALGVFRRFVRDLRADGYMKPLETQAIPFAEVQKLLSRD
jgi:2-methylisocitrate lyase-like PEP mutase family enzyme